MVKLELSSLLGVDFALDLPWQVKQMPYTESCVDWLPSPQEVTHWHQYCEDDPISSWSGWCYTEGGVFLTICIPSHAQHFLRLATSHSTMPIAMPWLCESCSHCLPNMRQPLWLALILWTIMSIVTHISVASTWFGPFLEFHYIWLITCEIKIRLLRVGRGPLAF